MLKPSSYMVKNLQPGESIVKIFVLSKGLLGSSDDVVLTNLRLFGRMQKQSFSLVGKKIKNLEALPNFKLLGRSNKGSIVVSGPYKLKVTFPSQTLAEDRDLIIKTLQIDLFK